jgi:GAF domain-containing protein
MAAAHDPVLHALIEAAVGGTGGTDGWILAVRGDELEVAAAAGPMSASVMGVTIPGDAGTAGFVVGSGQPIALAPHAGDPRAAAGMATVTGRQPASLLCVPCESEDGVTGALEVVDKAGGGAFTFDDVELATLLAGVAGVALAAGTGQQTRPPDPGELAGDLRRLADSEPGRYRAVATVVAALLSNG